MPILSSRIYRSALDSDGSNRESGATSSSKSINKTDDKGSLREWNWDAAEERLRMAYDRGGVGDWAECALRELEAEEAVERTRRGL